jgi:hypothetical protein
VIKPLCAIIGKHAVRLSSKGMRRLDHRLGTGPSCEEGQRRWSDAGGGSLGQIGSAWMGASRHVASIVVRMGPADVLIHRLATGGCCEGRVRRRSDAGRGPQG